ncbi:DUF2180 family protein [Streptomyces beijiangensis]|uniref:DUF2180 family protein n=1 Tax=Streptomyces beijiangensis TaxID=163361 RepID=A0A939JEQ1_9ACTN|nr:DUF2180 family protein [Streptomyces beijiangensis]MBO0513301.1 DUF2180 family protein [Streptomyces beijiangensis]
MNCYDCLQLGTTTSASAVCTRCGAGTCQEHTKAGTEDIHREEGTGLTTLKVPARRLTCVTCHDAEHQF